ncbi:aminoglycoside 6'-N-acetyltransferase [Sphingomonas crusticola]|uniref:aminoglycoside 6'-N-acetyltransferase n=1 Tax=Sphingomonas crusticola TaxID=1697973 RepID=UPI003B83394B
MEGASHATRDAWLALRLALWPDEDAGAMAEEIDAILVDPGAGKLAWLALDESAVVGFAEASIRHDYVNGCETSPVAFLEGIYVAPHVRRQGVGRQLNEAVIAWAHRQGCREYASDALLENRASHAFHAALGFIETERVVYFRQALA